MLDKATPSASVISPDRVSLKQRVLSAGAWSLAGFGLSQALSFGSNLIMARLLMPEMFGLIAVATIVMIGLAMFSDVGLGASIIRSKRGADPVFLNTAWTVQIVRGLVLWSIALVIATLMAIAVEFDIPPKGSVYADPQLPYVIAVLSLSTVLSGFTSTKALEASRNLSLSRLTAIDLGSQAVGLLGMIVWASINRSVWALVVGGLCTNIISVTLSHIWLRGTSNRLHWDRAALEEIIQFGKWVFASSILTFLAASGDRLLLGGLVNVTLLGVYVIAFLISGAVERILTKIIGGISFPALSEVARERPRELKRAYYRFHLFIASFSYFCSGLLMTSGQTLVRLLYDPRYDQAGRILEILAAALLALPFQITHQTFLVLGKPWVSSQVLAVRVAALFIVTPIALYLFGFFGAVWGIASSYFLCLPIVIAYALKYDLLDWKRELWPVPMGVLGVCVGLLVTFAFAAAS